MQLLLCSGCSNSTPSTALWLDVSLRAIRTCQYVLAHGVKEGLVGKVTDWPGVHCVQALMTGETVQGYWYDETQEYAARCRGEDFDQMRFATLETLTLSPFPCWKHLSEEKRRKLVADLIAEIEAEAAVHRQRSGSQALGASAVRGQHPFDRPKKSKKSPVPWFHAASKAVRQELYEAYGWFVAPSARLRRSCEPGTGWCRSLPLGYLPP